MNVYMTAGTYSFLKNLKEKKGREELLLLESHEQSLLYHETEGKTVFATPRKYEMAESEGALPKKGFFAMIHVPAADDERPGLEHRYKTIAPSIGQMPGFLALRLLRPKKSDTYILLTAWDSERSFTGWRGSASYEAAMAEEPGLNKKIFSGSLYLSKYIAADPNEKENG